MEEKQYVLQFFQKSLRVIVKTVSLNIVLLALTQLSFQNISTAA